MRLSHFKLPDQETAPVEEGDGDWGEWRFMIGDWMLRPRVILVSGRIKA